MFKERLCGPKRIPEERWFSLFQPLLLELVNTSEGRDLLEIDHSFPEIVQMNPHSLRGVLDEELFVEEFRTHSRWAKNIRHRWPEFQKAAKRIYELDYEGEMILRPVLNLNGFLVAAHATNTYYPDPHPEVDTVDGSIQVQGSLNWNTAHDNTGSSVVENDDASTGMRINSQDDSGGGTDIAISRAFILFKTLNLGLSAQPTLATMQLHALSKVNTDNDGQDYITIIGNTTPASNTALVNNDFDNCGAVDNPTKMSNDVDLGSISTSAYNTWTMSSTGLNNIQKTGITKWGVREGHDIEDVAIAPSSNNQLVVSSADTATTSQDPLLSVTFAIQGGGALLAVMRRRIW